MLKKWERFNENVNNIANIIINLRDKYIKEIGDVNSAYDINNGYCEEFADDVIMRMGGHNKHLFELGDDMFFNIRDVEFAKKEWGEVIETKYGVWSMKMLGIYGYPPIGLNKIKDEFNHTWVYYKGKHYDAELPQGTKEWYNIPLIKRKMFS